MNNIKKYLYIIGPMLIILVIIFLFLSGDKSLDVTSKKISTLYSYLGTEDIYHCGGLNVYRENPVTVEDINPENTLCMAYYGIKDLNTTTIDYTTKDESNFKICDIKSNITFITDDNKDFCTYTNFTKNSLNNAYKLMYGQDIKDYTDFDISLSTTCKIEGEKYYCGKSPNYLYTLGKDASIYRLLIKAIEQPSKDIIIYDYFLRISDNKCYSSNSNNIENEDCTKAVTNKIDKEFIKKYGTIYKHTYKKQNNNHYWFKSEIKS